ncbi:hypothetical protein [Chryseobacterium sp. Leaf201]|uniref:hypothetical protein n=1 Tax=Chryseobacterium sp. Leaf201 TaxID=1735672 RepID=UPI0007023818|nr:hypothetical protein [Chryseobacterium sp. Leaf201]KQM34173.1 hypothetical protein ASE55_04610 [Chryseobacterium sp. Leaf201]
MKTKYAVIIFLMGFLSNLIGAFLKITHYPNANLFFVIASILESLGMLIFIYKLMTYPKFREFMNW